MGVIMQAFYWDCPRAEDAEHAWWDRIRARLNELRSAGFTALWLPPANKAASWKSMGYDPYDYYDLGECDQRGGVPTWFGSREALEALIRQAHTVGMQVYADLVLNHNSGADAEEDNPIDGQRRWTRFKPRSKRFERDWKCFHPSPYETWDGGTFGEMPDLCHRNPHVYAELIEYARSLLEDVGFDGFRYDCVKGYGGWMVRSIQELRILRGAQIQKPFGVGECWDSNRTIENWLDETNAWSDNPASAFDFPLRARLQELCDGQAFQLTALAADSVLSRDRPERAVTFVENHDVARSSPIVHDKMLAYAYILTHEGYPCVFWQDYFGWDLGQPGAPSGIEALVRLHESHAGGSGRVLHADNDLYAMQRDGFDAQPGLVLVLNNRPTWNGAAVQTAWRSARLVPAAWRGRDDLGVPAEKRTDAEGRVDLWAPPRGYAVYLPSA